MTFWTDEASAHDSKPIELYKFVSPTTTYRYANAGDDYAFSGDGGATYTRATITRGKVHAASSTRAPALEVRVGDVSLSLIQDHAFDPGERELEMTLYRVQTGTNNYATLWKGKVGAFTVSQAQGGAHEARLLVPSLMGDPLDAEVPNVYFQAQCNHTLGDSRCGVNLTALKHTTTVSSASGTAITVASDGGQADGYYAGGQLVRVSDGERRLIIDHTGNVMTVSWEFGTILSTDSIELYPGCDRSLSTCETTYSNRDNFGGHPHVPTVNLWRSPYGIKGATE